MTPAVRRFPNASALALAAAERITSLAETAARETGSFALALAGGGTPKAVYALLAESPFRERFPWSVSHFFPGDERMVPLTHPDSNFRMADEALFSKLGEARPFTHPVPTDAGSAEQAATLYEASLCNAFDALGKIRPATGLPVFDLILLGVGQDGHTASLFPGSPVLEESERWAASAVSPPDFPVKDRVTLTYPVINAAASVLFLAAGKGKAAVLDAILSGSPDRQRYPAARVQPDGTLEWFVEGV